MSASKPTAAPIICAGCKDVIQMPGTYLQVRGKKRLNTPRSPLVWGRACNIS